MHPERTDPPRSAGLPILIGLVAGLGLGAAAHALWGGGAGLGWWVTQVIQPLGKIFIRLIFMIAIPLVVASILLGIQEMRGLGELGRVGLRSLGWTLVLAASSVGIGVGLANLVRPGAALDPATRAALIERYAGDVAARARQAAARSTWPDAALDLIPQNPLAEAVRAFEAGYSGGGLLSVMVASVIIGVAMMRVAEARVAPVNRLLEGVLAVCISVVELAMKLAPLGVACLMFSMAATTGWRVVQSLGLYVAVVIGGLLIQVIVTYGVVLRVAAGRSLAAFLRDSQEALATAFGTSSSNATLPVSLRVAEHRLGVPPRVGRFVLTVGATANQNGTALFEGATVLFLAQVFGHDLTLGQQGAVVLASVLAGVGTAGVPGGSIPLVMGVLASVGVPPESIALVLGVDRLLDMCRTVVNVAGDLVVAVLVGRAPDA